MHSNTEHNDDKEALKLINEHSERLKKVATRESFSKLRNDRDKATFSMMMRMNPDALIAIRKEFFSRKDSVNVHEFVYVINKHLMSKSEAFDSTNPEQRDFASNMYALFKDIDINGDGNLEWQEFTSFTIEKANILNKQLKMTNIAHYYDSNSKLDSSAFIRHRHDISRIVNMPPINQFAMVEDHKSSIFIFNSRYGKKIKEIVTDSPPVSIQFVSQKDRNILVVSGADMTMSSYSLDDPNPNKRYQHLSTWTTPVVQMAMTYSDESKTLYSGGVNGQIYSWKIKERSLVSTLSDHSDIVMSLLCLKQLNNIASASLDKAVNIWDTYTSECILKLQGHKKGVFDLTYTPDYRLLVSCGFEHDACVWSPFVNSMVYRLKGHHASLVGVQCVEGTPELITADTAGVFKLWDVRNFQCIQTFAANLSGNESKDSSKMSCFFHTRLPVKGSQLACEDDSRIYAASKLLFSFDQARIIHEATTDYHNVFFVGWSPDKLSFITVSEKTVIVWDALLGSKTTVNEHLMDSEISACCLDSLQRKVILGSITGKIKVFNPLTGACLKSVADTNNSAVVALAYIGSTRGLIAGYADGVIRMYDESNPMEDCHIISNFEVFSIELKSLLYNPLDFSVVTTEESIGTIRFWDSETGKCEQEINACGNSGEFVTTILFLDPFPLLVTADSVGNVIIWGSRGCKMRGKKLSGFLNATIGGATFEPRRRKAGTEEDLPRRAIASRVPCELIEGETLLDSSSLSPDDLQGSSPDNLRCNFSYHYSKYSTSEVVLTALEEQQINESTKEFLSEKKESEQKWGRISPVQAMGWSSKTSTLFVGDELGMLRCFDLQDFINDVHIESHGQERRLLSQELGNCRKMRRNSSSALPPFPPSDRSHSPYVVGHPTNMMSYLGISFSWALSSHEDRLISITVTEEGLLTSSADRMVKMWRHDGTPFGAFLQSVPVGSMSSSWDLELNIEGIMEKETQDLDGIIGDIENLLEKNDIPDIGSCDFSGIKPGNHSAEFTKSVLRRRVDKTGRILGLDIRGEEKEDEEEDAQDMNDLDSVSSATSFALREVKSMSPTTNNSSKPQRLSLLQMKRQEAKMSKLSNKFQSPSGFVLGASSDPNEVNLETHSTSTDAPDLPFSLSSSPTQTNPSSLHLNRNSKLKSTSTSKLSSTQQSIEAFSSAGPRSIMMKNSCHKYSSFPALDRALGREISTITPEEMEEFRKKREGSTSLLKSLSLPKIRNSSSSAPSDSKQNHSKSKDPSSSSSSSSSSSDSASLPSDPSAALDPSSGRTPLHPLSTPNSHRKIEFEESPSTSSSSSSSASEKTTATIASLQTQSQDT